MREHVEDEKEREDTIDICICRFLLIDRSCTMCWVYVISFAFLNRLRCLPFHAVQNPIHIHTVCVRVCLKDFILFGSLVPPV